MEARRTKSPVGQRRRCAREDLVRSPRTGGQETGSRSDQDQPRLGQKSRTESRRSQLSLRGVSLPKVFPCFYGPAKCPQAPTHKNNLLRFICITPKLSSCSC